MHRIIHVYLHYFVSCILLHIISSETIYHLPLLSHLYLRPFLSVLDGYNLATTWLWPQTLLVCIQSCISERKSKALRLYLQTKPSNQEKTFRCNPLCCSSRLDIYIQKEDSFCFFFSLCAFSSFRRYMCERQGKSLLLLHTPIAT